MAPRETPQQLVMRHANALSAQDEIQVDPSGAPVAGGWGGRAKGIGLLGLAGATAAYTGVKGAKKIGNAAWRLGPKSFPEMGSRFRVPGPNGVTGRVTGLTDDGLFQGLTRGGNKTAVDAANILPEHILSRGARVAGKMMIPVAVAQGAADLDAMAQPVRRFVQGRKKSSDDVVGLIKARAKENDEGFQWSDPFDSVAGFLGMESAPDIDAARQLEAEGIIKRRKGADVQPYLGRMGNALNNLQSPFGAVTNHGNMDDYVLTDKGKKIVPKTPEAEVDKLRTAFVSQLADYGIDATSDGSLDEFDALTGSILTEPGVDPKTKMAAVKQVAALGQEAGRAQSVAATTQQMLMNSRDKAMQRYAGQFMQPQIDMYQANAMQQIARNNIYRDDALRQGNQQVANFYDAQSSNVASQASLVSSLMAAKAMYAPADYANQRQIQRLIGVGRSQASQQQGGGGGDEFSSVLDQYGVGGGGGGAQGQMFDIQSAIQNMGYGSLEDLEYQNDLMYGR